MNEPDLLPCPFCGEEAFFVLPTKWSEVPYQIGTAKIMCMGKGCPVEMGRSFSVHRESNLQTMADAWNRRDDAHKKSGDLVIAASCGLS
jgi:hypothetical protein